MRWLVVCFAVMLVSSCVAQSELHGLFMFDDSTYSQQGIHLMHVLYFDSEKGLVYTHYDKEELVLQQRRMISWVTKNPLTKCVFNQDKERVAFEVERRLLTHKITWYYGGTYVDGKLVLTVEVSDPHLTLARPRDRYYLKVR